MGQFSFRDTILDQLERYFFYLKRMRKHDKSAYEFYRRLGGYIIPYAGLGHVYRSPEEMYEDGDSPIPIPDKILAAVSNLPPMFRKNRPGFGCIACGTDPVTEREENVRINKKPGFKVWVPKFMYFVKYESKRAPKLLQPVHGGDVYAMTVWWDRGHDPTSKQKWGTPQEFAVQVSEGGSRVRVLKVLETTFDSAEPKRRKNGHKPSKMTKIPKREWHLPNEFEKWAKLHGVDPETYLRFIFCNSVREIERAAMGSMTRVAVTKEGLTATFSVDARRTAYFFKDRDIEVTEGGRRRRICHVVAAHQRKDGSVVKMHFRGERRFSWAGYDVEISLPGKDHLHPFDFSVGSEDFSNSKTERAKAIYADELGGWLAENIKRGRGGTDNPHMIRTKEFDKQWRREHEGSDIRSEVIMEEEESRQ